MLGIRSSTSHVGICEVHPPPPKWVSVQWIPCESLYFCLASKEMEVAGNSAVSLSLHRHTLCECLIVDWRHKRWNLLGIPQLICLLRSSTFRAVFGDGDLSRASFIFASLQKRSLCLPILNLPSCFWRRGSCASVSVFDPLQMRENLLGSLPVI